MGLFNRKKKEPVGPYARITVYVKYSYNGYYVPEVYYFYTPEDFKNNEQRVCDEYNVDRDKKKIEAIIWDYAFNTYDY